MTRRIRYASGAAGVLVLAVLYLCGRETGDLPGWALGLAVVIVLALSVAQDVALWTPRRW